MKYNQLAKVNGDEFHEGEFLLIGGEEFAILHNDALFFDTYTKEIAKISSWKHAYSISPVVYKNVSTYENTVFVRIMNRIKRVEYFDANKTKAKQFGHLYLRADHLYLYLGKCKVVTTDLTAVSGHVYIDLGCLPYGIKSQYNDEFTRACMEIVNNALDFSTTAIKFKKDGNMAYVVIREKQTLSDCIDLGQVFGSTSDKLELESGGTWSTNRSSANIVDAYARVKVDNNEAPLLVFRK